MCLWIQNFDENKAKRECRSCMAVSESYIDVFAPMKQNFTSAIEPCTERPNATKMSLIPCISHTLQVLARLFECTCFVNSAAPFVVKYVKLCWNEQPTHFHTITRIQQLTVNKNRNHYLKIAWLYHAAYITLFDRLIIYRDINSNLSPSFHETMQVYIFPFRFPCGSIDDATLPCPVIDWNSGDNGIPYFLITAALFCGTLCRAQPGDEPLIDAVTEMIPYCFALSFIVISEMYVYARSLHN